MILLQKLLFYKFYIHIIFQKILISYRRYIKIIVPNISMNRSQDYRRRKNRKKNTAKRNPEYFERKRQKRNKDREKYQRSDDYMERKREKKNQDRENYKRSDDYMERKRHKKNQNRENYQRSDDYMERKRQKKNQNRENYQRSDDYMERKRQKNNQNRENYQRSDEYMERKRQKKNKRQKMRSDGYIDRNNEHKYQIRTDPKIRVLENQKIKNYKVNYSRMVNNYENSIREGPIHLCYSCEGLFFAKSISSYRRHELSKFIEDDSITEIIRYHKDSIQLCVTCLDSIKRGIIPKLCVINGLEFPPIPEELSDLTELEERLISPRLPFMQIRELGIDKQYGMKGNVVNIPINIDETVKLLPRSFDKTATIQILLKRMRQHKSTYIKEYIRLN